MTLPCHARPDLGGNFDHIAVIGASDEPRHVLCAGRVGVDERRGCAEAMNEPGTGPAARVRYVPGCIHVLTSLNDAASGPPEW